MQITQKKEKKRAKYRISFIFLFIFASFAICFTMYMKEDFDLAEAVMKNTSEENTVTVQESVPAVTEPAKKVINPVQKSEKADRTYFNSIAVIGGERMRGLADHNIIPKENVYIDSSFSVQSAGVDENGKELEYDALIAFFSDKKPEAVYFTAGLNDLGKPEENLFNGLGRLTDKLRADKPDVKIYYVSLLPVTADYENGDVTNINIDAYNSALLRYANIKNAYYLDLNTVFVGNDGKLPETMTEDGALRLKSGTYTEIGEYLLSHIGV